MKLRSLKNKKIYETHRIFNPITKVLDMNQCDNK
jgi:hypothetical protein